jgi:alkylated DNA repair protein alkB family protein 8
MIENHAKVAEQTWDMIAESFDVTRRRPWKQCIDFINELPKSAIVADLGCGNGRHLIPCAQRCKKAIGLDISKELLRITQNKTKDFNNAALIHGNLVNIPIKDNSLDAILYIASLHNIKGRQNRIHSLKEVKRVLKNDAEALISVWSRWQDRFRTYFLKKLMVNTETKEFGDININWGQHGLNIPRFYHLYSKREFVKDLHQVDLKIEKLQSVRLHSNNYPDNYFATVYKS